MTNKSLNNKTTRISFPVQFLTKFNVGFYYTVIRRDYPIFGMPRQKVHPI